MGLILSTIVYGKLVIWKRINEGLNPVLINRDSSEITQRSEIMRQETRPMRPLNNSMINGKEIQS